MPSLIFLIKGVYNNCYTFKRLSGFFYKQFFTNFLNYGEKLSGSFGEGLLKISYNAFNWFIFKYGGYPKANYKAKIPNDHISTDWL